MCIAIKVVLMSLHSVGIFSLKFLSGLLRETNLASLLNLQKNK